MRIFLPFIAGLIIGFLLYKVSCNHTGNTTIVNNPKYDSLLSKSKRDSIDYTKHISVLEYLVDEKTGIADSIYLTLSDQLDRNNFTIAKLRTAKSGKDTASYYKACDTLSIQYPATVKLGMAYKHERDSIINLLKNEQSVNKDEIKRINSVSIKKDSLNNISINSAMQDADKWKGKAGKRFGIGPMVGVTYNGNFKPTYGIGVYYSLIKF